MHPFYAILGHWHGFNFLCQVSYLPAWSLNVILRVFFNISYDGMFSMETVVKFLPFSLHYLSFPKRFWSMPYELVWKTKTTLPNYPSIVIRQS